jgi:hypothetical protein
MLLMLSGRRRLYVLLFFHERLRGGFAPVGTPPPRVERGLDAGLGAVGRTAEHRDARLVVSARVHRRWGRSLFGLSFFVLAFEAGEPSASATRELGGMTHAEMSASYLRATTVETAGAADRIGRT